MQLLITISSWFLPCYQIVGFATLIFIFFKYRNSEDKKNKIMKCLILFFVFLRVVFAFFLTVLQYFVWRGTEITELFLTTPVANFLPMAGFFNWIGNTFGKNSGYFYYYSFGRFWLSTFILLGVFFIVNLVIFILRKFRGSFFANAAWLFYLFGILLVGWPGTIIYLLFALILAVILDSFVAKEKTTQNLEISTIIAILTILLLGGRIITLVGFGVLAV